MKEYEEAPSGSVYFYNYKEPLMKFKEGFGFEGALIHDYTSNQIQCHFCGGWFDILGHHLHKEHNMSAADYKKAVGLNKSTALISETHRALLIKKGLAKRMQNLRPNTSHTPETRAQISASLREHRAEKQNQTNTCPEQLIERLVKKYNELGRTPSPSHRNREVTFTEALIRTYGSYKNACKIAGIPYVKPGSTRLLRTKYTRDTVIELVSRFHQENGRFPKASEYKSYGAALQRFGRKEIFKRAIANSGVYKKTEFIARYSKSDLINFLRMFKTINNRYPSISDCKRGLLPNASRYVYNFGSWPTARKIAFPEWEKIKKGRKSYYSPVEVRKPRVKGLNALQRMQLRLDEHRKKQLV